MCGIATIVNYGKDNLDILHIRKIHESLETRGTDASGIYFERTIPAEKSKKVDIEKIALKAPVKASELWENLLTNTVEEYAQYCPNGLEKFIMLHSRAKTKGSEYENNNNMPIVSDNLVLVHNGVISNHRVKDYKYKGIVDSEEILAYIETSEFGMAQDWNNAMLYGLDLIDGSMSIVLKPKKENYFYIYRNTNPMAVAYIPEQKILYIASTVDCLKLDPKFMMLSESLFKPNHAILFPVPFVVYKISTTEMRIDTIGKIAVKAV